MKTRKYDYLLYRVEYPAERGYRIEPQMLPDWIHITVTNDGESKYLVAHSRIHINRDVKIGPDYSTDYSDRDIIKDLSSEVSTRFL